MKVNSAFTGLDGHQKVWRKANAALEPKNMRGTVKHGGSIMNHVHQKVSQGAYIEDLVKHTSQRRERLQHKHPCLTRDSSSNPDPTAPQSASLTTIPDGRQTVMFNA
ncbi:hypothetical protein TNCV_768321 [Trichonephila clavipes]|nr:hypothetical protein TNCV_768321 [Trichonephila clavipes]